MLERPYKRTGFLKCKYSVSKTNLVFHKCFQKQGRKFLLVRARERREESAKDVKGDFGNVSFTQHSHSTYCGPGSFLSPLQIV